VLVELVELPRLENGYRRTHMDEMLVKRERRKEAGNANASQNDNNQPAVVHT